MIRYNIQYITATTMVYLLRIALFMNFSSSLIFWMAMEVNMVCLIFTFFMLESKEHRLASIPAFRYLVVQTLGSVLFFSRALLESGETRVFSSYLMIFCLVGKMGVFPFHRWVSSLNPQINVVRITLILTIQKIPILMLMTRVHLEMCLQVIIIVALGGSIMLVNRMNMREIVISSSIYFTIWAWFLVQISRLQFILSYRVYTLLTYMLLKATEENSLGKNSVSTYFALVASATFLVGLPPASIFFLKLNRSFVIWDLAGLEGITLIWFSVVLSTLGYLKNFTPIMASRYLELHRGIGKQGTFTLTSVSQLAFLIWMII